MVVRHQPATEYDRNYQWQAGSRVRHEQNTEAPRFAGKESIKVHPTCEPFFQHKRRVGPTGDSVVLGRESDATTAAEDDFVLLGKVNEKFDASVPYRNPGRAAARPRTAPPRHWADIEEEIVSTPETPRLEKPVRVNRGDYKAKRYRSPPEGRPYVQAVERRRRPLRETAIQTDEDLEEAIRRIAERGSKSRPATAGGSKKQQRIDDRAGGVAKLEQRKRGMVDSTKAMKNGVYYSSGDGARRVGRRSPRRYNENIRDSTGKYQPKYERNGQEDLRLFPKEKGVRRGVKENETRKFGRPYDKHLQDESRDRERRIYEKERDYDKIYQQWKRSGEHDDDLGDRRRRNLNGLQKSRNYDERKVKMAPKQKVEKLKLDEKVERKERYPVEQSRPFVADQRSRSPMLNGYAKKYQLGMAEKRPKPLSRLSEYQSQYEWKRRWQHEPPLAADDVFYRSHLNPPRFRGISQLSEYQRQYKPFRMRRTQDDADIRQHKHEQPPQRRALTPPPPKVSVQGEEYAAHETLNPQRFSFPHGRYNRRYLSEYSSKFRDYWHELSPMLRRAATANPPMSDREDDRYAQWYGEIMELRRKAEEHKRRAMGTHFSREHLAQLMSKKAALWDPPSSAEDRARTAVAPKRRGGWRRKGGKRPMSSSPPAPRDRPSRDSRKKHSSTSKPRTSSNSPPRVPFEVDGRLSTPRMQHAYQRHHLDRITPALGGALLMTPSNQEPAAYLSSGSSSFTPPPPAGKPSLDTHLLLDEDASHDTPIQSPADYHPRVNQYQQRDGPPRRRYPERKPPDDDWDDDDRLSIWSNASSSTLASDTLERARKRRDEFWGHK